jgi:hypothetical protein
MANDARGASSVFSFALAVLFGLSIAMPATAGVPLTGVGSLATGPSLVTEAKAHKVNKNFKVNKNIKVNKNYKVNKNIYVNKNVYMNKRSMCAIGRASPTTETSSTALPWEPSWQPPLCPSLRHRISAGTGPIRHTIAAIGTIATTRPESTGIAAPVGATGLHS